MNSKKKYLFSFLMFISLALMLLVHPVQAASVRLNSTSLRLDPGCNYSLMLKGVPASAYKYVTWTTSNSSIVELGDNNPYIVKSILPKRSGTAIVTAKYRGKSYRCKISVSKVYATCKVGTQTTRSQEYVFDPVGDIDEMSVSVANRFKTKTAQIKIYGNKSTKVKYMSSNSSVVTVSRTGKVTFNGKGVARISAVLYNKYTSAPLLDDFSFMITVNEPEVFTLNSAYVKAEKAGYNASYKISKDIVKYLNTYRKKAGFRTRLTLDSRASHAAGYILTSIGGDMKNFPGWANDNNWNKSHAFVRNVWSKYGVSTTFHEMACEVGTEAGLGATTSAEYIAEQIWDDFAVQDAYLYTNKTNPVYVCKKVGIYVGKKGTMVLFGK